MQEQRPKDSGATQDIGGHSLPPYIKFAFYHKSSIYFLNCNPEDSVIRYTVDENYHRTIPDSLIPNVHLLYAQGIQIGNYFWIFDGVETQAVSSTSFGKSTFHSLGQQLSASRASTFVFLHRSFQRASTLHFLRSTTYSFDDLYISFFAPQLSACLYITLFKVHNF